jgi:hypothetical protein
VVSSDETDHDCRPDSPCVREPRRLRRGGCHLNRM